jgi:hypothetical protein
MSHDIEAAWATTEIASIIKNDPVSCIGKHLTANSSIIAGLDKRRIWPIADGLIKIEDPINNINHSIAVEYKRTNEGLHGILTALGQSQAYLDKGFTASAIIIPDKYESHNDPGKHLLRIIEHTAHSNPILLFTYTEPDISSESPFHNKFTKLRSVNIGNCASQSNEINMRIETQWGHMREGSSDSSAFFLYLKTAKELNGLDDDAYMENIPNEIKDVLLKNGKNEIAKYLSNSTGDLFHDKVWRRFWFTNICFKEMLMPWRRLDNNTYCVNDVKSKITMADGKQKLFFSGRSDSIKNRLVEKLNSHVISESKALLEFADNIHSRAHSYREDIDSGLEALGLIYTDGRPTTIGYKFVDECIRNGSADTGLPRIILINLLLTKANYGVLLHYIYRVSENEFSKNNLSFSDTINGPAFFNQAEYLNWLENKLANELNVMRKGSQRGGQKRLPFQAEFAMLRKFGLVKGFRIGVGLEINWPEVQRLSNYDIN